MSRDGSGQMAYLDAYHGEENEGFGAGSGGFNVPDEAEERFQALFAASESATAGWRCGGSAAAGRTTRLNGTARLLNC